MTTSWHNLLFGAFDQAGVMTVDKPPLALWVQALSAKAFGFSSLIMLVPQALMGVAAVGLTYDLTRRVFGRAGGLRRRARARADADRGRDLAPQQPGRAARAVLRRGAVGVVRGLADGRTRWLVLAGAMIGLGFETKMAAALIVVPGLAAAWLWAAPGGRLRRVAPAARRRAAMVVVGGVWPLLVALTPAADRPWISGTTTTRSGR